MMESILALTSMTASGACVPCATLAVESPVGGGTRWAGVLGVEGETTGDGRLIEKDALRWGNLPLPLRYVSSDMGAHDGAQVVGQIERIWRGENGEVFGAGTLDDRSPQGKEAIRQVGEGLTTGVSLDLDDVSYEVRVSPEHLEEPAALSVNGDGTVIAAKGAPTDELRVTTSGRIRAVTIVAIPAFASAKITLSDETFASSGLEQARSLYTQAVAALRTADSSDFGTTGYMDGAQAALDLFQQALMELSTDTSAEAVAMAEKLSPVVDRLEQFLSVDWENADIRTIEAGEPLEEQITMADQVDHGPDDPGTTGPMAAGTLQASAAPHRPPAAWFGSPALTGPTPVTVTEEGRVYGHLAAWATCHIGQAHRGCVTPPRSRTRYSHFRLGTVLTREGTEISTGPITMGTRHAGGSLGASATLAHYEDTGDVVADVAVGEDAHGIWVAGALRPDVTADKVRALRASPLSGDWRRIGNNLELVAALAVNTPGFPIPRPSGLVASGHVQSLVASGMVPPARVLAPGTPGALSMDDLRYLKRLANRERSTDQATALALANKVQGSRLAMRRYAAVFASRTEEM